MRPTPVREMGAIRKGVKLMTDKPNWLEYHDWIELYCIMDIDVDLPKSDGKLCLVPGDNSWKVTKYFGDGLRFPNTLALFGMDWNTDVFRVYTNRSGVMTPRAARRFLRKLRHRESMYEYCLENLIPKTRRQARQQYEQLQEVLNASIDLSKDIQYAQIPRSQYNINTG